MPWHTMLPLHFLKYIELESHLYSEIGVLDRMHGVWIGKRSVVNVFSIRDGCALRWIYDAK